MTHVKVQIHSAKRIQSYQIDHHLGRLVGNNLQSKLYLAHLHALTSSCLPDLLTGLSGTEQALKILRGADVQSFCILNSENVDILVRIANLTPKMRYMDRSNPGIQVTTWQRGGPGLLAQHPGLYSTVQSLLSQANDTRFLYPSQARVPDIHFGDAGLLQRYAIRSSTFYTAGFGAEEYSTKHDVHYGLRSREDNRTRIKRALQVCAVMDDGKGHLMGSPTNRLRQSQVVATIKGKLMGSGSAITRGAVAPRLSDEELQYYSRWLGAPSGTLPEAWLRIHQAFASQ